MRDLSPKDLARSLGVSESSVKRWVDDGAVLSYKDVRYTKYDPMERKY